MKRPVVSLSTMALSALLMGLLYCPCRAQGVTAAPDCLAVKVGALWPSSALANHDTGAYQGSADVELSLANLYAQKGGSPLVPALYVDYNAASKSAGYVNCLGAGASIRAYSQPPGRAGNLYIGGGVGGYYEDIKSTAQLRTLHANDLALGWKAFVGVDISPNVLIEAGYQGLPEHAAINPSGPYAQVGLRF